MRRHLLWLVGIFQKRVRFWLSEQVAVGVDRTRALEESRASAEALHQKNQELLRATELKNQFLANLAVFRTGQRMMGTLLDVNG